MGLAARPVLFIQFMKWGLSCDEGEKQINYVKSEYIGRSLVTFCGIFIVLITLAIIAFICGKGIQSFTQSGISFTEMLTSTKWNQMMIKDPSGL